MSLVVKLAMGALLAVAMGAGVFFGYQKVTEPELIRTIEVPIDGQTDVMQWVSTAFGVAAEECRQHPDAEQVRFTFDEAGQGSGFARQYYDNIDEMPGAVNCVGVPGSKQAEAATTTVPADN